MQTTFVTLKQIVKLDLSRNMLVELPENFGEMTQLKHLDLYANKVKKIFFLTSLHICIYPYTFVILKELYASQFTD